MRHHLAPRWTLVWTLGLMLLVTSCSTPPKRTEESASAGAGAPPAAAVQPPASTPTDGRAQLAQLERDARALAKTSGCSSASACRTAPVGWRGCGGPRAYIVYCAASTDSAALFRKLDELKAAEMAYNEKEGMISTCEMRMPPGVALVGGSCSQAAR